MITNIYMIDVIGEKVRTLFAEVQFGYIPAEGVGRTGAVLLGVPEY